MACWTSSDDSTPLNSFFIPQQQPIESIAIYNEEDIHASSKEVQSRIKVSPT